MPPRPYKFDFRGIIMKKALRTKLFAAVFAAAFSIAAAGTASAAGDNVLGYVGADFEDYEIGDVLTTSPVNGASIYLGSDVEYSIVDRDGGKALKILSAASRQSAYAGIKLIPNADALDDAEYWVVSYDLKNGDHYPFYTYPNDGAIFGNEYPYINHQLQFRNDGNSIMFPSGTRNVFTSYDWHSFTFIGNQKTGNIRLILDGKDLGETKCDRIASLENFYGIQIIDNKSGRPYEHVMYVDNMEIYGFDFDVSCALDGTDTVKPSDTIELTAKGYVDTSSFDSITLSSEKDSDIAVTERSYDAENGVLTLKLSHEMMEFTTYTLDFSGVKCGINAISSGKSATFKTTGEIEIENTVSANGSDKLTDGINEIRLAAKNVTDMPASICMIAELIEDGKTTAMSYKNVTLAYGEEQAFTAFFKPTAGNAAVKAYIKNAVNGTIYYGSEFTVTASGTAAAEPEDITEKYPIADMTEQNGFYSLKLGTDGKREKLDSLTSAGLIDCTADVGNSENLLIAAVKKDGKLVNIAYSKGSGIMHTAVFADKDCRVEMYVWSDIFGTGGKGEKAALAAK